MAKKSYRRKPLPANTPFAVRLAHYSETMPSGCIEWMAGKTAYGYGVFCCGDTMHYAHRTAWEIANGVTIPPGMLVCHTCDNPPCINPDRLFLGTKADNHADMRQKGRMNKTGCGYIGEERLTDADVTDIIYDKRPSKDIATAYGRSLRYINQIRYAGGRKRKMRLTNKFNLPRTIINAVERDPYSMGEARMSVTGLLKPPRIGLLYKKHSSDIERDVADSIWSLAGRAMHLIAESGSDEQHVAEERLSATVRGWLISGGIDLQIVDGLKCKLIDYKFTSAYAVMSEKADWKSQLNMYAWLAREAKGYEVQSLSVCAMVRDWSRYRASDNPDYPQSPILMIDLPLWDHATAQAFAEERVRIHQHAISSSAMGDEPPECTDEERWMRPPTWAVKRIGNKRATKVHDALEEAEKHLNNLDEKFTIEHRKSEPIRCTGDYCHVSAWCSQYAKWKKDNGQ